MNDAAPISPVRPMESPITPFHSPLSYTCSEPTHTPSNKHSNAVFLHSTQYLHDSMPSLRLRDNARPVRPESRPSSGVSTAANQGFESTTTAREFRVQSENSLPRSKEERNSNVGVRKACGPRVRISFGTVFQNIDGKLSIQNVSPHFSGYPCSLDELDTPSKLVLFQKEHFDLTYTLYGLDISDFVGVGTTHVTPNSRYTELSLSFTQAGWEHEIRTITHALHMQCSCDEERKCTSCSKPIKVVLLFNKLQFNNALETKIFDLAGQSLIFLDNYNGLHARKLMKNDFEGFLQYNKICRVARETRATFYLNFHRNLVEMIRTVTPRLLEAQNQLHVSQKSTRSECVTPRSPRVLQATKLLPTKTFNKRAYAQAVPRHSRSVTTRRLDSIRGPKGNRLFVPQSKLRVPPATKYSKAAEQPVFFEKGEQDSCLTCIYFRKSCTGTKLVLVDGGLRCEQCAHKQDGQSGGTRKCYWRNQAKGILTYEDARDTDQDKIVNLGNTRAAKREKAVKRLARIETEVASETEEEYV